MDRILPFTEEHEQFREMARKFFETEVKPHHEEWEKNHIVPKAVWIKAGDYGLLCPDIPEEYGGSGIDGVASFDGTNTSASFASTTGAAPNLVYTLTRNIVVAGGSGLGTGAGTGEIVVEQSIIRRWQGGIYERVTRYAKAL